MISCVSHSHDFAKFENEKRISRGSTRAYHVSRVGCLTRCAAHHGQHHLLSLFSDDPPEPRAQRHAEYNLGYQIKLRDSKYVSRPGTIGPSRGS